MDPGTIAITIAGSSALTGAGASAVTALVGRRLRRAQVRQITTEAHSQIYQAYGQLLAELRVELAAAREEVGRYRAELIECRSRGERISGELAEVRDRLDSAESRETKLAAEVRRLTQHASTEE